MALATFIGGAYTSTYNSLALGITDAGFKLQFEPKQGQGMIEKSDVFGEMMLDWFLRGCNYFIQCEFMEWKSGPLAAAHPMGAIGTQGIIARLASDLASAMVMTSTAGTPAVATPATLTGPKAILAPGSNPESDFDSRLRTLPVRMALLPYDVGAGVIKNFVTT